MSIDKRGVVAVSILLLSPTCFAFVDPYTITMGIQAVSGIMGAMKDADEVADIGISASELMGEFDVEHSSDSEIQEQIARLEELNRQSREFRDVSDSGKNLFSNELDKSKSLSQKLKSIREMVQFSKRIAALMGVRPKSGERALKVQEIKLNYLILDELMAIRQIQFSSILESKAEKERLNLAMARVLREEGRLNQSSPGRKL